MHFRTLLLDRDGTLNADSNVVKTPDQIRLLPGVIEGLRHFRVGGAEFFIVSNQGSVGHGDDTEANALACTQRVVDLLAAERLEHQLDRLLERGGVLEQRGDVVEQDARLGEVGDLADLGAQVVC